jgi:hypothetical protein
VGFSGVIGWVGLVRFAVEMGGRRLMRLGGGSVCACLRYQRWMLALSWTWAISASVGVSLCLRREIAVFREVCCEGVPV